MRAILNHQGSLFAPAKADALAAELNADVEDDFRYDVIHCPNKTGLSFIKIFDEADEFVGKL